MRLNEQDRTKLPRPPQSGRGNFFARPLTWMFGVLAATVLVYMPGLHGPFLFDDSPNIVEPVSAWLAHQINWQEIVFGNRSGPLHRPLSMLTFYANAATSGLSTWPFKATNLAIHLLCGALIYALLSRLLARDPQFRHCAGVAALVVSALWLLHPMQVSTVLYVVQRMEQLCALFVITALLIYVHGRVLLERGRTRLAKLCLFLYVPLATLAAVLSKENGALIPLFCAILEFGYFRPLPQMRRPQTITLFFFMFLLAPAALVTGWYVSHPQKLLEGYSGRLFTVGERLLSEPRALADYIGALLLPRGPSLGLYTDDFAISHNLFDPVSTLPAMLGLCALGAVAWYSRIRIPAFFVGIAVYFAGHTMESTVFPLELYFEHRNYLPSVGFFLAVVGLAHWLVLRLQPLVINAARFGRLLKVGVIALLVTLGLATMARASVWSSWPILAAQGAHQHPNSIRAQADHATNLVAAGRFEEAQNVVDHLATLPNPAAKHLAAIDTVLLQCLVSQKVNTASIERVSTIKGAKLQLSEMLAFEMLGRLLNMKPCQGLNELQLAEMLVDIVDAAQQPQGLMQIWRSRYIASRLYLSAGKLADAERQAKLAWESGSANPAVGLYLANLEYLDGDVADAKRVLTEANQRTSRWDRRNQELSGRLTELFESAPPFREDRKAQP